jgi:hypothetical protein
MLVARALKRFIGNLTRPEPIKKLVQNLKSNWKEQRRRSE